MLAATSHLAATPGPTHAKAILQGLKCLFLCKLCILNLILAPYSHSNLLVFLTCRAGGLWSEVAIERDLSLVFRSLPFAAEYMRLRLISVIHYCMQVFKIYTILRLPQCYWPIHIAYLWIRLVYSCCPPATKIQKTPLLHPLGPAQCLP